MFIDNLAEAIDLLTNWQVFAAIIIGLVTGLLLGAIPGITGGVAMAVSLTICYYLDPIVAIMFLSATYTGGITGGSISAILLNMPGSPGSVATAIDGFQMTRQGRHNYALGLALFSSVAGTFLSYLLMGLALIPVTGWVSNMGPADRIAVAVTALLVLAALRGKHLLRSLIACAFGLLLSTLGTSQNGVLRSEFLDMPMLFDGLPLVPTIIGLLAFSELLNFIGKPFVVDQSGQSELAKPSVREIYASFGDWAKRWKTALFGGLIGFIVGVIPAAGSSIASLFAYGQAKSLSKHPEQFGEGAPDGVVVAESANNGSEGGAMLTTLALGIPGSGASAILLSGFLIFGLVPGPVWIANNIPFAYSVVIGNLLQAVLLAVIGAMMVARIASIIYVPVKYLAPALVIVSSAGMFALRGSVFDICIAWLFAYVGYIFKKYDYPPIGVLLGLMLGPTIESEIYRIGIIYSDDYASLFTRPVVVVSIVVAFILLGLPMLRNRKAKG